MNMHLTKPLEPGKLYQAIRVLLKKGEEENR
jgi:DNA-binding response OmpR family regulator